MKHEGRWAADSMFIRGPPHSLIFHFYTPIFAYLVARGILSRVIARIYSHPKTYESKVPKNLTMVTSSLNSCCNLTQDARTQIFSNINFLSRFFATTMASKR